MINKTICIKNKLGLHARAAAKLVRISSQFTSDITLQTPCKEANGKSIMSIMMLAAGSALIKLIEQKFDEKE